MDLITNVKTLNTVIKSIATRGQKLDADIHLAACSCLNHAAEHGDVTLASKLILAMPKSSRAKALIHWFETYGKLTFKKNDGVFGMNKGKSKEWNVPAAIEMPFWKLVPEPEVKDLTIEALVKMVKSKITKAKDTGHIGDGFTIKGFESQLTTELATLEA